jgi:hypothetical protein
MLIAPEPDVPAEQRAEGSITLRYEDVAQDGRVVLGALPSALGVVWREIAQRSPSRGVRDAGIVPLLARLTIAGGAGPVSVLEPLRARGCMQLACSVDAGGEVDKILLLMWASVTGTRGRTHGPPPPDRGEPVEVGRVFAEHVFTRPFAPPDRRRVVRLEAPGLPEVPEARWTWRSPQSVLELPEGATALDPEPTADAAPVVFGLDHTDSNQHVNSLVYPRLLTEAALRRFAALGTSRPLLARAVELAYRKPSFVGDAARWHLRAFDEAHGPGATGILRPEGEPDARPLVTARIRFG